MTKDINSPQAAAIVYPGSSEIPMLAQSSVEGADNYCKVISKTDKHRVIECRDAINWIIQQRRGKTRAGPRWRSISYCTTREALMRIWPCVTGQALLVDLPERIGGSHGEEI